MNTRALHGVSTMNYAVSEYKPILENPRRLGELDEARDLLIDAFEQNGVCIAKFEFGEVALPPEMLPRLTELVGRTVAVFRLDGKFHCREVGRHA